MNCQQIIESYFTGNQNGSVETIEKDKKTKVTKELMGVKRIFFKMTA